MTKELEILISEKKKNFRNNYSVNSFHDAAKLGIIAAIQHGYLYTPNLLLEKRNKIKFFWENQLVKLSEKYKNKQTLETFISDIIELKNVINEKYKDELNNGHSEYDNGFRVAHAQKSLSICLKHLWCHEIIKDVPPVCPIDSNILYAKGVDIRKSWVKCNNIEDNNEEKYSGYRSQIKKVIELSKKKGFDYAAQWELCYWTSDSERKVKRTDTASSQKDLTCLLANNFIHVVRNSAYLNDKLTGPHRKVRFIIGDSFDKTFSRTNNLFNQDYPRINKDARDYISSNFPIGNLSCLITYEESLVTVKID